MKHFIDANTQSDEFRRAFRAIRDGFVSDVARLTQGFVRVTCRACDENGNARAWIRGGGAPMTGSVQQLQELAAHMIDQGMCVAVAGVVRDQELTVWLSIWESPEVGPVWPRSIVPAFELLHEGVFGGSPGAARA